MTVYFAVTFAVRQRGTSENINGFLRQFFQKEIDISNIYNEDLAVAVKSLIIDKESVLTISHRMNCSGIDQVVHM